MQMTCEAYMRVAKDLDWREQFGQQHFGRGMPEFKLEYFVLFRSFPAVV